jgi:hypothetical protein
VVRPLGCIVGESIASAGKAGALIAHHIIEIRGLPVAGGRLDPDPLGAILRHTKRLAVESVGMAFRHSSHVRGPQPTWMKRASDVRLLDMSRGVDDSTLLHFEAPRFGEVAEEIYQQRLLFGTRPDPTDTAFDIMGDILMDVARCARDSERFDSGILKRLEGFNHPVFDHGVDVILVRGDRLPTDSPPHIDRALAAIAASLYEQTPAPVRARVAGRLDVISPSSRTFSLILKDGRRVSGIWLGPTVQPLRDCLDREVVVNGVVAFRPSGSVLRIDAEAVDPASPSDQFFSKLPDPGKRQSLRPQLLQPQSSATGMSGVFGQWPGDESDEEVLQTLEEIE